MPSVTGPNPLSVAQFQGLSSATSGGAAANGLSSLAGAMIGDPARMAQSQYYGAEAGRAQVQAQTGRQSLQDGQTIAGLLTPNADGSGGINDPQRVQAAAAIIARNPDIAAHAPAMFATMAQMAASAGKMDAGAADRISAGTGVQTAGGTFSGQALDNQNKIGVANIGAGATLGSAKIAAGASTSNNIRDNDRARFGITTEDQRARETNLVSVGPSDGSAPPTYGRADQSAGKPAYQPTLAGHFAQNDSQYQDYQGPGNTTVRVPQAEAARRGLQPRPQNPAQVTAGVTQDAMSPAAGSAPIADDVQRQAIVDNTLAQASGRPAPGASSPQDAAAVDKMIGERLMDLRPVRFGKNTPAQELMDPVRLQAVWLHDHDPQVRGDWNAAVTQAVNNVAGQGGQNLDRDLHYPGQVGDSKTIRGEKAPPIIWPKGMPVPAQYGGKPAAPGAAPAAPQTAPAAPPAAPGVSPGVLNVPSPLAQHFGGTQPGAPAPTLGNVTPQDAIAQARVALAAGKDPQAVAKRLTELGIDPSVLGGR